MIVRWGIEELAPLLAELRIERPRDGGYEVRIVIPFVTDSVGNGGGV